MFTHAIQLTPINLRKTKTIFIIRIEPMVSEKYAKWSIF